MKKVLLATSALVASAGIASADITLSGSADIGVKDTGATNTGGYLHNEIDFNIVASTTTDGGYTFGASIDLDDDTTNSTSGAIADQETYISGPFGKITVGDVSPAADGHGLAEVGFDGIGVDDDLDGLRYVGGTGGTAADVVYTTTLEGMSVTLSYAAGTTAAGAASDGDFGVLVGFDAGEFGVTVGYSDDSSVASGGAGAGATSLGLTYSVGGISLAGFFADNSVNSGSGFSASYALDANTTISAVYNSTDITSDKSDFGIGFSTDLGGGVKLAGGIGRVDATAGTSETAADLGFNIAF
jgi:outer membrane protein OmpU